MNREEVAKNAVLYKHSGFNCAQAVVKAIAESEGIDDTNLLMQAAGFGVGMGTMETTCGALIGANMMAGIKTKGQGTIMKSRELYTQFSDSCGASICKELKGTETGKMLCDCDQCVRNAIVAYDEVM